MGTEVSVYSAYIDRLSGIGVSTRKTEEKRGGGREKE